MNDQDNNGEWKRCYRTTTHISECTGYRRLTSLWSALVTKRVTEALIALSISSNHTAKEVLDLDTEQVLLLTLIYSLVNKDTAASFALSEIATKVEPLKSPSLQTWLQDNSIFSSREIRRALRFAAHLARAGLGFPQVVLAILENLYFLYCTPKNTQISLSLNSLNGDDTFNSFDSLPSTPRSSVRSEYSQDESPIRFTNDSSKTNKGMSSSQDSLCKGRPPSSSFGLTEPDAINDKTGLHLAVARDDLTAVLTLLEKGASVDLKNQAGLTPFQTAVERENIPVIKALHQAGANINQKNYNGESLLHIAVTSASMETIKSLIHLGANVDSLDNQGQTPLFKATKKGYIGAMEKLKENGANMHAVDRYGRTLLHYAAWHGQIEAIEWLLKNGLNINGKSKYSWTPLHWAVVNRHQHTAQHLLQKGASVNARDSTGRTPLLWATEAGNLAMIELLKSYDGNN